MPNGRSLHIGLNAVDPAHYAGWSGPLIACEADANDMRALAQSCRFEAKLLLTPKATRAHVGAELHAAAKALKAGDIFLLTYSGHGGQLPDLNGDASDDLDETWCLYDGGLVDDELYKLLREFVAGVRVLVVSDSCHSGSVTRDAVLAASELRRNDATLAEPRYRAMPMAVSSATYYANKTLYDPILTSDELKAAAKQVKASVLLIAGCQDNQLSTDGAFNGRFTEALKTVWNGGKFRGGYREFSRAIGHRMNTMSQSPNLLLMGAMETGFVAQKPFTI